jgi:hypothetical protein
MIRRAGKIRVVIMRRPVTILLICGAASVQAQATTASAVCWRAKPLANCKTWVITEAAVETRITSTSNARQVSANYSYVANDFGSRLAFTFGGMKNLDDKRAVGFTMSGLSGVAPARVEGRYRRWLPCAEDRVRRRNCTVGLDFSAGVVGGIITGESPQAAASGLTGSVGISNTYLGADARIDLLRAPDGRIIHGTFVSLRAGSRAGPTVVAGAAVALLGLFAILFSQGGYT